MQYYILFFVRGSIKYIFFIEHAFKVPMQPSPPLQMKIYETLHYQVKGHLNAFPFMCV